MASLGHIAVGMAASRFHDRTPSLQWQPALLWASLSMLPDADVIGLPLGVDYTAPWGHRGATHSLLFAAVVGLTIGALARWRTRSGIATGLLATLVLASHSLLDTMTDGGLGCALLWPFDLTRYFAPWRPIPVSPIGLAYLSPYGFMVAVTELVIFSPLFVYALRRR
jgi:inner membrane protein